jgi:hypothetical protein
VGVLGLVALLGAFYLFGSASTKAASAAAPITVTAPQATITAPVTLTPPPSTVDTDTSPAFMNPKFAPPDGPDPDDPMYGVDVVALAGEFRTHGVDTPPEKYPLLLAMTNRHIARGEPDLEAWDRLITEDTHQLYPDLRLGLVIDVTRCWAEYVERVIARNAGKAAPPDSDDHGVTVSNRGPQPRITKHPIVTPTS